MDEKLTMQTKDLTEENVEKIAQLFPSCVTEAVSEDGSIKRLIDFEALKRQLSGDIIPEGKERYVFTWPGKSEAQRLANTPTTLTLRPCRDKSVNFDDTKNVYTEGDNLDALKLLRETYLGSVKMIYIDPPYNTGSDFVYIDDFKQSREQFTESSGDYDDMGNRLVVNSDSSGRYHTNWLNMIYPRLLLSKDLLSDDGLIFISIGIAELSNLKKICDEIYGYNNFISQISWVSKIGGSADEKTIINAVEYILVYAKNSSMCEIGKSSLDTDDDKYKLVDEFEETRGKYLLKKLDFRMTSKHYTDSLNYPIIDPDGNELWPGGKSFKQGDGWNWRWGKDKVEWGFKNGFLQFVKNKDGWTLNSKQYQKVDNKGNPVDRSIAYRNYIGCDEFNTTQGSKAVSDLFGSKVFEYAKPVGLLVRLMNIAAVSNDDIVLDFFSGSATISQSVFDYNLMHSAQSRFIAVQIPQKIVLEGQQVEYDTICELAIERIRRCGTKYTGIDTGFRVFEVDSSNMNDIFYNPQSFKKDLLDYAADNIKTDRTGEDLLFQVMLELGIELSVPIVKKSIAGKEVLSADDNYLIACFDDDVDEALVTEIAKRKPYYAVFRDSSMSSDAVAINFGEIFKTYSPDTKTKVL